MYELAQVFGVASVYERDFLAFQDVNRAEYVAAIVFLYKLRRDSFEEYEHQKIYEHAVWQKETGSGVDFDEWLTTYAGNILELAEKAYNDGR